MARIKLSKAYSQYGASMGRRDTKGDPDLQAKFSLVRIPLDSGGYDSGGAYWGSPSNLYRASVDTSDDTVEMFLRANSRNEAKSKVRAEYPNATFYR